MLVSYLARRFADLLFGVLRTTFCLFMIAGLVISSFQPSASAASNDADEIELSRAGDKLDRVVGAGTSDLIQGKAQEDLGTLKRNVGKVTGQLEGATDQIKGRAQQDLGRTQQTIDEADDTVTENAQGFAESVRDFFGH